MPLAMFDTVLDAPARLVAGTHRTATLEQTWKRFAPAAKRAGITRIADLTGLDTLGVPVFAAIRPRGKSLSAQQGKGLTPLAAKVSALMESLETWTAEEAVPTVRGSMRALKGRIADVQRLPRPRGRLDQSASLDWVRGCELGTNREVLVPLQSVTLDATFTRPPRFDISSNGLASGNVLVEAVLHGLCEVLERDAEAAWRRSGGDRRVVLDTITDPACRALVATIVAAGARVFVWDLGSDAGLCAIGAAIMEDPTEPAWRTLGFYQGFGAHMEPAIAIARALTEAAQTRLTYIAGARDDFFPEDYARATDTELLLDLWERLAGPCDDPVDYADLTRLESRSLGDALEQLVELNGPVLAVDLTHPKLKVPVVKVLVPGRATDLEHLG